MASCWWFREDFGDVCYIQAKNFEAAEFISSAYAELGKCVHANAEANEYIFKVDNRARLVKSLIETCSRN